MVALASPGLREREYNIFRAGRGGWGAGGGLRIGLDLELNMNSPPGVPVLLLSTRL